MISLTDGLTDVGEMISKVTDWQQQRHKMEEKEEQLVSHTVKGPSL